MPLRVKLKPPRIRKPRILPKKPDIVIGIPTYNEAENIGNLVKTIDSGLSKYFPDKRALILNADSDSPDGTRKAFLSVKTKASKQCIKTPRGKGAGVKKIFEFFLENEDPEVLVLIDGDVTSATPRWIRNLATPVMKGFDHVLPIYNRHEYDGAVTNHFAYPLVRSLLGIDIRQPLGGEVGLSRRAVDRIYNRDWPVCAEHYGIDAFSTLSSVFGELKIATTYLGMKEHKPREDKISNIFEETASALFTFLERHRNFWSGSLRVRKPPSFFKDTRTTKFPSWMEVDYKKINEVAIKEFDKNKVGIKKIVGREEFDKFKNLFKRNATLHIDSEMWMRIVFSFVRASEIRPSKRAKLLLPIFLGRFLSFYKDFLDKDYIAMEKGIVDQSELFYKERELALSKKEK